MLGLIVICALTTGLTLLGRKYINQNVGHGMGHNNNKNWGIEEDNNKY